MTIVNVAYSPSSTADSLQANRALEQKNEAKLIFQSGLDASEGFTWVDPSPENISPRVKSVAKILLQDNYEQTSGEHASHHDEIPAVGTAIEKAEFVETDSVDDFIAKLPQSSQNRLKKIREERTEREALLNLKLKETDEIIKNHKTIVSSFKEALSEDKDLLNNYRIEIDNYKHVLTKTTQEVKFLQRVIEDTNCAFEKLKQDHEILDIENKRNVRELEESRLSNAQKQKILDILEVTGMVIAGIVTVAGIGVTVYFVAKYLPRLK